MNFLFMLLVLGAFAPIPDMRHPTPPNQSNPNPSFPVNQMDSQLMGNATPPSQSNQTPSSAHPTQPRQLRNPILPFPVRVPSSPSHPTQLEQDTNPIPPSQSPSYSPPPGQNNLNPQFPLRMSPSPDHVLIQLEQQCYPTLQSQSPNHSPPVFPVYQRASQSASSQRNPTLPLTMIHPFFQSPDHSLPPTSPYIRIPWYRGNEFMAIEPARHGPLPHELDRLSLCVLNYFFACGLTYTSVWSQHPNLSTSIHIQCFLNQASFSLFLLANAVFPRTRPALAFVLDRFSFLLIVISSYIASMPMFPPYISIIMFLVVAIVYVFARFRGNT